MNTDPNEEVEQWKDAFYSEIKKLSDEEMDIHIKKRAEQVIKKYDLRPPQYLVKKRVCTGGIKSGTKI